MLRYFRYLPPTPIHQANDGHRLELRIHFAGEAELVSVCNALSIPLAPTPAGVARSAVSIVGAPSPIADFPRYLQPGHTTIAGERAFVWVMAAALDVTVMSLTSPYELDDEAHRRAERIERALEPLADRLEPA